jgi:hypothetical protein
MGVAAALLCGFGVLVGGVLRLARKRIATAAVSAMSQKKSGPSDANPCQQM